MLLLLRRRRPGHRCQRLLGAGLTARGRGSLLRGTAHLLLGLLCLGSQVEGWQWSGGACRAGATSRKGRCPCNTRHPLLTGPLSKSPLLLLLLLLERQRP